MRKQDTNETANEQVITTTRGLSADLFPVKWEFKLRAFEVGTTFTAVKTRILNQLTYHLGGKLKSTWCNCEGTLITDFSGEIPDDILDLIWLDPANRFGDILTFNEVINWSQKAIHEAEMANAKFKTMERHIKSKLECKEFGDAFIQRACYSQAFVVDQKPHLALSISSPISYKISLAELISKRPKLELLSLQVKDSVSGWPSGTIVEVTGNLDEATRTRLLSMTKKPKQRELIEGADNTVAVVKIRTSNGVILEYATTGLSPIPIYGALSSFGLNQFEISNYQRISSNDRQKIIQDLIHHSRLKHLIGNPVDSQSISSFRSASNVGYDGKIQVGNNQIAHISGNIQAVKKHGMYRIHEKFQNSQTLRVAVLNGGSNQCNSDEFLKYLRNELSLFGFHLQISSHVDCNANKFAEIEKSIGTLVETSSDIILSILPEKYVTDDEGLGNPYQNIKRLTINRGIMNQAVSINTVNNPRFKLANLALGMLAKVGNTPWILPTDMGFCDRILGADVSREPKSNQRGTRNELGIPRWYSSNGDFLKYILPKSTIEGERIPMSVIREITPSESFSNKRILFHGDGNRPSNEIDDFLFRGEELGGKVMVIEVIKKSPFRIYSLERQDSNPKKGDWIKISESEALLISTLARHNTGTPQPLHIRCTSNISIEDAVLSVLQLSDLHYGSQQQPRCPITTHDAHHISKKLMMNVRPPDDEGNVPWWL